MGTTELEFSYLGQTIRFILERKSRKTLGIRVHPDGRVRVLASPELSEEAVLKAVRKKAAWVLKQVRYFSDFQPVTPPREYVSGETHWYLGRQYRLRVWEEKPDRVRLVAGWLNVYVSENDPQRVQKLLDDWYRQRAVERFRQIWTDVAAQFEGYRIQPATMKLKRMEKRWGSCTPEGVVYLNPELIRVSSGCIAYVITHEFCHLVRRRHDRRFYDLLAKHLPDWERWKAKLERTLA